MHFSSKLVYLSTKRVSGRVKYLSVAILLTAVFILLANYKIVRVSGNSMFPAYQDGHGLRYLVMRRIDSCISIALITGKDVLSETMVQKLSLLPEVVSIVQSVNTAKKITRLFGSRLKVLYGEPAVTVSFVHEST